uniref:Uncharacterized protein n=1 Tax=Timema douglasi TaxID=61478 RepID=A0A7R8VSD3_TIMDO|nr:unnamed protein product [Timema douglasi]
MELGVVPVKEASVVIAVSSPHRAESLLAVQFAIDALKSSVPIWKKEVYATDTPQWKSNSESKQEKEDLSEDLRGGSLVTMCES